MAKFDVWHSRPFDVHVWSEHKEVMDLTEEVFLSLGHEEQQLIKGRSNNKGKTDLYKHLRHVLVDQYVSYKLDPSMCTGVARGKTHWKVGSRYNGLNLSPRIVDVIDVLIAAGYLEYSKGSHNRTTSGRNRTSRIFPTDKLTGLFRGLSIELEDIQFNTNREVIILNQKDAPEDENAKPLAYEDTPETIRMRAEVQAYNQLMFDHFVDVASLEHPYIETTSKDKKGRIITKRTWTTQDKKFVRRTFSRGSFKLNGRWNGGFWQQLPKALRQDIYIDGSPTHEYDYSALHPNLLAKELDGIFDEDAYTIGRRVLDGITETEQRAVMKGLLLKVINAKTVSSGIRAFQTEQHGYEKKDLLRLLDAYIEKYPFMENAIGSDKGISLMYTDSEIVAHVIAEFVELKLPVLPIHDSFIVREDDLAFLDITMERATQAVAGSVIKFSYGLDKTQKTQTQVHPNYELRWQAWGDRHPDTYYPDLLDDGFDEHEFNRLNR